MLSDVSVAYFNMVAKPTSIYKAYIIRYNRRITIAEASGNGRNEYRTEDVLRVRAV
jgi:hypothetical protein